MSITSVGQSLLGTGQAATASSQLANDYQSFIKLLVAQVQNQDPLAPMESTEFVSQLAQLTQVEQSVQVNAQMENLRLQLAMNSALSQTAMIGREVTALSGQITLGEEGSEFWYSLDQEAASVQAEIVDDYGMVYKTFETLPVTAGALHHIAWDGKSNGGIQVLPGVYKVRLTALDGTGKALGSQSYASAKVVAVDYAQGESRLELADGRFIASGDVIAAR